MSKKNLPHIPLYIGDWEKDCNVLSLESEAAWLRIIFKMFSNGKQSESKMKAKALQNLWRVSENKMIDILDELKDNNICEISDIDGFISFKCRRFERENAISEIRSESGSKGGRKAIKAKLKQTKSKTKANILQNADNDNNNDNDNNIEIKGGGGGKTKAVRKLEFIELLAKNTESKLMPVVERDKFISYWCESGDNDLKLRFENEKIFEIKARISRWMANTKESKPNYKHPTPIQKMIDERKNSQNEIQ